MVLGLGRSCRGLFKKLSILPVACLYMLSLMTFVVDNPDKFQSNSSLHNITRKHKDLLYIYIKSKSFLYKRGFTYSDFRSFL